MLSLVSDLGKKLHHRLFRAPKGYGKPVSTEVADKFYKTGVWDFLDSVDELANYMVVVGYVRYFSGSFPAAPRILDLGCGSGNIAELLSAYKWERYVGLDISGEAVKKAGERDLARADFRVENFEDWEPDGKFDFIISTGAIHYASRPAAVLQNYSKALSENGKFVISLWRCGPNKAIWREMEKHFEVVDATIVENRKGVVWDIKVLR